MSNPGNENARRRDLIEKARQMAAQIDAQREPGAPSALSIDAVEITELRSRWLEITSPLRDRLRKPFAGIARPLSIR